MTGDTEQQTVTRWMAGLARSAVAALLLSVLGAGAAAARQQIFVRVGDGTTGVAPGGQISIPIDVDMSTAGGLDLASITFELNWNPSLLSYVSVSPGSFGSVVFNESQTGSGLLTTSMFSATGTTSSFTLATVVFQATDVVPDEGQRAPIAINVTAAGNEAGSSILGNVVGVDLVVCIGLGRLLGDVNDDGVVNIIDAQQIARFSVGLEPPPDPQLVQDRGDVTEDGVVNIIDAQQIARHSVGLPTPGAPRIGEEIGGTCEDEIPCPPGISGEWQGTIEASMSFPLTLSLTDACDGSVSGTGTILTDNMTIDGSRSGSDVTLTMTVEGFIPFIFTGTWDLANTMTGVVNESGFVNAPMTVTRGGGPGPDLMIVIPPGTSGAKPSGRALAGYAVDPRDVVITAGIVLPGDPVTLSPWIVVNQGNEPSGDFSNGFYLSADPTITASDTYLDGNSNTSLAPGESFPWGGPTVTIPAETAQGSYYIGILVDNGDAVVESNETNNWVSWSITIGEPCGAGVVVELEPNDDAAQAGSVGIPGEACGEVNPAGDGDYWSFSVAAGTTLDIDVDARLVGSPLDPQLELFDTDGVTRLAFNDDFDGLDSFIRFTFATGGTYFVKINGFAGSGGDGYFYTIHFTSVSVSEPVLVLQFDDAISFHNMSLTSDGSHYYTINGGNAASGEINKYDLNGQFVANIPINIDARAILYNPADGKFYVKTYLYDWYEVDPNAGSATLVHAGIFAFSQSSPTLDYQNSTIYEHSSGTVQILDFATGSPTGTLSGFQSGSYPSSEAITTDGTYLFTWDGTNVYRYDFSGILIDSFALPFGTYGFSLSYENGLLWVSQDGGGGTGTWYGYQVAAAPPSPAVTVARGKLTTAGAPDALRSSRCVPTVGRRPLDTTRSDRSCSPR